MGSLSQKSGPESGPESGPHWGAQSRIQWMLRAAQAGTALHSHSSVMLIYCSGCSHVCSGLEVEMEFGEVKIGVVELARETFQFGGICSPYK